MAVQYFDIDDQWNAENIKAAEKMNKEFYSCEKGPCGWKSMGMLPEDDDEAVEVKHK